MTTLMLTLDDEAAAKAREAAKRRHTSLEEMLQGFVVSLSQVEFAEQASAQGEAAAQKLIGTFQQLSRPLGGKGYMTRDELYER